MTEHEAIDERRMSSATKTKAPRLMEVWKRVCALDDDRDEWMDTADQAADEPEVAKMRMWFAERCWKAFISHHSVHPQK